LLSEYKIARFQVHVNFTLTAFDLLKGFKIEKVTSSIDFRDLVQRYLAYMSNTDRNKPQTISSWLALLATTGSDARLYQADCSLSQVKISRVELTVYRTLSDSLYRSSKSEPAHYFRQIGVDQHQPEDVAYDAIMSLYAISRARVQYLGSCIPLFRFRHALFEALIATIHEQDLRPASGDEDVNQLQNPI
jgi:hypothetical protein